MKRRPRIKPAARYELVCTSMAFKSEPITDPIQAKMAEISKLNASIHRREAALKLRKAEIEKASKPRVAVAVEYRILGVIKRRPISFAKELDAAGFGYKIIYEWLSIIVVSHNGCANRQ